MCNTETKWLTSRLTEMFYLFVVCPSNLILTSQKPALLLHWKHQYSNKQRTTQFTTGVFMFDSYWLKSMATTDKPHPCGLSGHMGNTAQHWIVTQLIITYSKYLMVRDRLWLHSAAARITIHIVERLQQPRNYAITVELQNNVSE